LAAKTNTSVDALRLANCLPNNNIVAGQQLRLPFLPPPPTATWTPTATSSPTATQIPPDTPTATTQPIETPTETPTHTATPPDVSLGTPTPTISPTLPVVLPTDTLPPPAEGG
jgi:LysM repeat protein